MIIMVVALWLVVGAALTEDAPPGLVATDSEQDLVAEATGTQQAQKREAALSNSYGEPLPSDAYGPPPELNIVPDIQLPAPVYGVPELQTNIQNTPPGAYGPPSPVVFPSQVYEGPPPPVSKPRPVYGPPKHHGPPKHTFSLPKPIYGPPKKTYGPPKQIIPKPNYGVPLKPPKFIFPKPTYGVPKPVFGPPKPIYGPPKQTYGPPILPNLPNLALPDLPTVSLPQNLGGSANLGSDFDVGFNLPAPVYGTPFPSLPLDLKPNFPIPADTYGPPGHALGPVGPNDHVVVQEIGSIGHYGPPQPDPNPRPPHPGIPAPPTPPHVLYDGWKPIPGVSKPSVGHVAHHVHIEDQYGPPPPPPAFQEIHLNLDEHSLPSINQAPPFVGAQISTGYSSVHQDALSNIDLNAIVGGDSNHIDQSKTVFEVHYTETNPHQDLSIIQASLGNEKLHDSYGAPPLDSLSGGPYPASIRQHGAKGLVPPAIHGPPSIQYGPPRPNLPIPYGTVSGGGHTGGSSPKHPIKFRESVPTGLFQQIGHTTHHKDAHGIDHSKPGPTYLPPPIRDVKDVHHHTGSHGFNQEVSISIEPSNLYSLPQSGNPIIFNQQNSLYGSHIDSYAAPLLTVSDHAASGSSSNAVTATVDGTILSNFANLSNLDAAAILKHCPYHEAILKAAQLGEKIPADLASSYVASLSSLGSSLSKSQQTLISPQNSFNTPIPGSESVSYNTKDLATASHTLVHTILPSNDIKKVKTEKNSVQKGKSIKDETKNNYKDEKLQYVSQQIIQTSEKIKNLNEEAKQLQQKIVSTGQNLQQVNGRINQYGEIPVKGKHGRYSLQIQSADSQGKGQQPSIPHDQLLSEGLLQSILQAIEQPSETQVQQKNQRIIKTQTQTKTDFSNLDVGGLVLPAGYEPVDRTKTQKETTDQQIQASDKDTKQALNSDTDHRNRGDIPQTECDLRSENSIKRFSVVLPPPKQDNTIEDSEDNEVAIYFDKSTEEKSQEPVTEISVATSISEDVAYSKDYGEKISKKQS